MKSELYNRDCLEVIPSIGKGTIDLILCDLPYGVTGISWDKVLPYDKLWEEYERVLKDTGNIILFASGNFTIDLILSNRKMFKYRMVWEKNRHAEVYESMYIKRNG